MSRPVIIVGGGGHARVLIDVLLLQSAEIIGISDPALEPGSHGPFGLAVLGDNEAISDYPPDSVELVNGIGSTHSTLKRRQVYELFCARNYRFASIIHPSAIIAREVSVGDGVQIMAGSVIQTGTVIGCNTIINTGAKIDHDCRIGDHVHIAPGAVLSGGVVIDDCSHIGAGASVIQSVHIGRDCLVGAGTVALRDAPDGAKVITPITRTTIEEA